MSSRPLNVLVFSGDRSLLRHLSRFLDAFGYQVRQAAQEEPASVALEWGEPDVLIVDSGPTTPRALELCRSANRRERQPHPYVFQLVEKPGREDLIDALEAGVDDFLAKPIVYGELLVRLRAGVRALEFERRFGRQGRVEPLSGLLSRPAFHRELGRALSAAPSGDEPGCCVAADLDFFDEIRRAHGRAVAEAVVRTAAAKLGSLCGESDVLGCFGGARFVVWLPGTSEGTAAEWAENARAALEDATVDAPDAVRYPRASFGVAEWSAALGSAEQLVRHALEALDWARASGGQCVVRFGELDAEAGAWEQLAASGKLFERTLARHVMTPWPLALDPRQTARHGAAMFRQTGLRALPVVDASGDFAGLVFEDRARVDPSENGRHGRPLSDVMTTDVATCDEHADFAELIRLLEKAPGSLVVICRNGSPTGFVTLKNLTAMSEPLDTGTFSADVPPSGTSDYLLVDDPGSMDAA